MRRKPAMRTSTRHASDYCAGRPFLLYREIFRCISDVPRGATIFYASRKSRFFGQRIDSFLLVAIILPPPPVSSPTLLAFASSKSYTSKCVLAEPRQYGAGVFALGTIQVEFEPGLNT